MTKKELIKKALELNLEVNEEMTNKEIEELIDNASEKEEEVMNEENEKKAAELKKWEEELKAREKLLNKGAEEEVKVDEFKGGAGVFANGKLIRVYTEEAHGEDFKELAKQFVEKRNKLEAESPKAIKREWTLEVK